MDIRIKSISLRNFKGARDCKYTFDGRNARIEGTNGSGKSTVFDAFTWLLFGKDHRDQTAASFEVKTIDQTTGAPIPRLDHWVEAELLVDGATVTLRRAWVEKWEKPTGETDEVMRGHTTEYFVNGQNMGTQRAFDQYVRQWIDEDTFKLITNPLYFLDGRYTDWKARRKALLELVKDAPERARVREEFADVMEKLSGRSVEAVRKQVQAEKRANKKDLDETLARIAGMTEALPAEVDTAAVQERIAVQRAERDTRVAELKGLIEEIDAAIADAGRAMDTKKAEIAAIWAEISRHLLKMGDYIADRKKAAQEQNASREQAIMEARSEVSRLEGELKRLRQDEVEKLRQIQEDEEERGHIAAELKALGERYSAERAKAFDWVPQTTCPTCGQELPAASIEEARDRAREKFMEGQKMVVDSIIQEAKNMKARGARLEASINKMGTERWEISERIDVLDSDLAKWNAELKRRQALPVIDIQALANEISETPEVRAMQREEQELRLKASRAAGKQDGTEELTRKRRELEEKIRQAQDAFQRAVLPLNSSLSVNDVRKQQLELIERKRMEAKTYADILAANERMDARLQAFMKADIDSVEGTINGLFRTARWKMFDRTIDGGLVEMCEVCGPDGAPYSSMNDAMKALCGMDVIRVFSERYGAHAPIFIDNAEGIVKDSFDTDAQVIRLVVNGDRAQATVIPEE